MIDRFNRNIFYNSIYNFGGKTLPLFVAIFTVPIFIKNIGTESYGVLTIIWVLIGYFGIFDFGLSCATTKYAAEYLISNDNDNLINLISTSFYFLLFLGMLSAIIFFLLTPLFINKVFKISPSLIEQAQKSFYVMAAIMPFVFTTACLQGVLEAQQRFALINAIRFPASLANYLGPLPVFLFTNNLFPIVLVIAFTRLLVWFAFLWVVFDSFPMLKKLQCPKIPVIKKLFSFGSWITVSNIISPLMVSLDRFVIGSFLSVEAISYYAVPSDLLGKIFIIPSSLLPVLFPTFSALSINNSAKLKIIYKRSIKYIFIVITPIIVSLIILSYPIINIWLGEKFAEESSPILQILAVGVLLNALARTPYSTIQAIGRPDLTAKLHIFELPFYLFFLWLLISNFGLIGVALSWVLRVSFDAVFLFYWAHYLIPGDKKIILNIPLIIGCSILSGIVLFAIMITNILIKVIILVILMGYMTVWIWHYLMDEDEKAQGNFLKNKFLEYLGFKSI